MGYRRLIYFISLLLFPLGFLYAEPEKTLNLTLKDAINICLTNNQDIQISSRELTNAMLSESQAFWNLFIPTINLKGSVTILDPSTVEKGKIETTILKIKTNIIVTNIPPYGPTVITNYSFETEKIESQTVFPDNYSIGIEVSKPIFMGGTLYHQYLLQQKQLKIKQLEYKSKVNQIMLNLKTLFYNILLVQDTLNTTLAYQKRLEENLRITEREYRAGIKSYYDLLRAQVDLKNNIPQIENLSNTLITLKENLKLLLNLPKDVQINIVGTLDKDAESLNISNISLELLEKKVLENNIDLKLASLGVDVSEIAEKMNLGQFFPQVVAFFNYKWDYKKVSNSYTDNTRDFVPSWTLGVSINIPISSLIPVSKEFYNYKKSLIDKEKTELQVDKLRDYLLYQVKQEFLNLMVNERIIDTQVDNVKQAEEGLKIIRERYRNGMASNLDLQDAEVAYLRAKSNLSQAIYNYLISINRLKLLMDEILEVER